MSSSSAAIFFCRFRASLSSRIAAPSSSSDPLRSDEIQQVQFTEILKWKNQWKKKTDLNEMMWFIRSSLVYFKLRDILQYPIVVHVSLQFFFYILIIATSFRHFQCLNSGTEELVASRGTMGRMNLWLTYSAG